MTTWVSAATVILAGAIAPVIGRSSDDKPLFTARQAAQGKAIYAAKCAPCHADNLQGGSAGPLVGPAFADNWGDGIGTWAGPQLTVEDLDFIIRTTMPKGAAAQMSNEEHTAVLAYVLQQNGYEAGAMPLRAGSLQMKEARLRFGIVKEVAPAPAPLRVAGDPRAVPKSSAGPAKMSSIGQRNRRGTGCITRTTIRARVTWRLMRSTGRTRANFGRSAHFRPAATATSRLARLYIRGRCTSRPRGIRWHSMRRTAGRSGATRGRRALAKCGGTTEASR